DDAGIFLAVTRAATRAIVFIVALPCACAVAKKGANAPERTAADPLHDAQMQLADNATRLRALGIELGEARHRDLEPRKGERLDAAEPPADAPPPPPPPPPTEPEIEREPARKAAASRGNRRCDEICELADVACGLQERICALADTHVGDPRYEDACWR